MIIPVLLNFTLDSKELAIKVDTDKLDERIAIMLDDAYNGDGRRLVIMTGADMNCVVRAGVSEIVSLPEDAVRVIQHSRA